MSDANKIIDAWYHQLHTDRGMASESRNIYIPTNPVVEAKLEVLYGGTLIGCGDGVPQIAQRLSYSINDFQMPADWPFVEELYELAFSGEPVKLVVPLWAVVPLETEMGNDLIETRYLVSSTNPRLLKTDTSYHDADEYVGYEGASMSDFRKVMAVLTRRNVPNTELSCTNGPRIMTLHAEHAYVQPLFFQPLKAYKEELRAELGLAEPELLAGVCLSCEGKDICEMKVGHEKSLAERQMLFEKLVEGRANFLRMVSDGRDAIADPDYYIYKSPEEHRFKRKLIATNRHWLWVTTKGDDNELGDLVKAFSDAFQRLSARLSIEKECVATS